MEYAIRDVRWLLIVLFSIVNLLIETAHARECYVCGIGPNDPLYTIVAGKQQQGSLSQNTSSLPHAQGTTTTEANAVDSMKCSNFGQDSAANLAKFIVQCPDGYRGCITQWDGEHESRTCNMYLIDDCKVANRVTYCYCNTDRCNGRGRDETEASMVSMNSLHPKIIPRHSDDEDDDDDEGGDDDDNMEASGYDSLLTTINTFSKNETTSSSESVFTPMQTTSSPENVHRTRSSATRWGSPSAIVSGYFIPLLLLYSLMSAYDL